MNFNLFTPNQSLNDLSAIQTPKNTAAIRNNSFATKESTQNSSDDDSFARMMERIKTKTQEQQQQKNAQTSTNQVAEKTLPQNTRAESQQIQPPQGLLSTLLTPITGKTNIDIDAKPESDQTINNIEIASLIGELTKLIDETANKDTESKTGNNTLTSSLVEISAKEPSAGHSLFNLVSSLLSQETQTLTHDADALSQGIEALKQEGPIKDNQSLLNMLTALQTALNSDTGYKLLSNLTSEELSALDEGITKYLNGELNAQDERALEEVLAQFVALVPPQEKTDTQKISSLGNFNSALTKDASLTSEKHHAEARYDARFDKAAQSDVSAKPAEGKDADFKTALNHTAMKGDPLPPLTANDNAQSAGEKFLQSGITQFSTIPSLNTAMGENTLGVNIANMQQAQTTLATTITQAHSHAQPHPATQMVSATIQKAVKEGDGTKIKLNLDPPELGRVEVKMSIDKDNKAKIVLTVEKPETQVLLQKDSDALQRAMANAGLDMDSEGGLSFELASDNHDFNNPNGHNERGQARNKNNDDFAEGTNIETTMDWHVDPETGRMRYNTLV